MPLDLSGDETAALAPRDRPHHRWRQVPAVAVYPDVERDPRQAATAAARARAVGAAEGLCAATSGLPTQMRTELGPPMTLGRG